MWYPFFFRSFFQEVDVSKGSSSCSVLVLALFAAMGIGGCSTQTRHPSEGAAPSDTKSSVQPGDSQKSTAVALNNSEGKPAGLMIIDEVVGGGGSVAKTGDRVTVHYTGWLTDGTKFDSSRDKSQPFSFSLGAGEVIPGWDQGVTGMKVGGKRKLTIPPELGYGARGAGGVIPPNATLKFDVELLKIN
jgi:FKBP-type peptidyl-prolyl cis-trans isomerase FkpA